MKASVYGTRTRARPEAVCTVMDNPVTVGLPMAAGCSLKGMGSLVAALHLTLYAGASEAQSEADLAAARTMFAQGVADEDAKRYETALAEFRRVAEVKETANVRYRIASCLEALGRMAEAMASYETAVRVGEGDPGAADAVRASRDRAAQLDRLVPRLTIAFARPPPAGAEVELDDTPVDPVALRDPIALDPGHHSIAATAPGVAPFHTGVTLSEGGRVTITVDLAPAPLPETRGEAPAPTAAKNPPPVGAYVALGIGAALAGGSIASFVLRASNIDTLNRDCSPAPAPQSGLQCPVSSAHEVNPAHDAAQVEGPLGIGLAAGAAMALGLGVWLLVRAPWGDAASSPGQAVRVEPWILSHGGGLVVSEGL
jgi:hypothetical protein